MIVETVYYTGSNNEVILLQVKVKNNSILHPPKQLLRNAITVQTYLNIVSCKIYMHCNKLAFDF